jgi:hypothetical protein
MFVQLATIAQLYMDVPLESDGRDFIRFVLSMTICGEFWTVEYAFRASAKATRKVVSLMTRAYGSMRSLISFTNQTLVSTVATGNWALRPKAFLGAVHQVMKENMPNLVDAARRMKVLMDTAKELEASPPDVAEFEIAAREYTGTAWRRPKLFGNKQEVSKETPEQTATGETGEPSPRSEAASSRSRDETESSDDSKESEEKATPLPSEEAETDVSNMQAKIQSSDAGLCGIP